jgi:hypothetical protein
MAAKAASWWRCGTIQPGSVLDGQDGLRAQGMNSVVKPGREQFCGTLTGSGCCALRLRGPASPAPRPARWS